MPCIKACLLEVPSHGVVGSAPLPMTNQAGKPRELLFVEAQRLANLTRRRAPSIADDVRGHCRAELRVALVDVLNHLFALIPGGQVEVDVGPLAAVLVEKALEEQLHANRIDGGDFERVANGGVGR